MRVPLITPLAARDGTVEKDERLVNCFGEQDIETKTTMVIKRAGIDEGDAVISGNDIYGQGLFNYDGYLFAIFGDVMGVWVYVGGSTQYGGGGGTYYNISQTQDFNPLSTYDINDTVIFDGQKLYSQAENNDAPPDDEFGQYMWSAEPGQTTYKYACLAGGYWAAGPAGACNSYLWEVQKSAGPGTDYEYTASAYPGSCEWTQATPPGNPPTNHSSGIIRA